MGDIDKIESSFKSVKDKQEIEILHEFEKDPNFRKHILASLFDLILDESVNAENCSDSACRARLAKIQGLTAQLIRFKSLSNAVKQKELKEKAQRQIR